MGDSVFLATNDNCQTLYGGQTEQTSFDVTFYIPYTSIDGLFLTPYMIWFTDDFGNTWANLGGFEFNQYGIIRKNIGINWLYNLWTVGEMGSAYYCMVPFEAFYQSQTPDTLDLYEGDVDEYSQTIWAVGEKGEIIYSTNLGISYQKYPSPVLVNLNDVEFSGKNTGWAVGENGTLLRYDGDWYTTKNYNNNLNDFEIYPNPFINEFYIRINSNENKEINVYIFDLTGKLISKTDKIKVSTGNSKINFSDELSNLKPGIYFIEIIMNNKIIRQKIVKK